MAVVDNSTAKYENLVAEISPLCLAHRLFLLLLLHPRKHPPHTQKCPFATVSKAKACSATDFINRSRLRKLRPFRAGVVLHLQYPSRKDGDKLHISVFLSKADRLSRAKCNSVKTASPCDVRRPEHAPRRPIGARACALANPRLRGREHIPAEVVEEL